MAFFQMGFFKGLSESLMPDNIIQFPSEKVEEKKKIAEIEEIEDTDAYTEASEIAEIVSSNLIADLSRAGVKIKVSEEEVLASMIMTFESIRSLILLCKGNEHPLQTFSSRVYEMSQYDDFIEEDPSKIFAVLAEDFLVYRDEEKD